MKRSPLIYLLLIILPAVSIFAAEANDGTLSIVIDLIGLAAFAMAFFFGWKIYSQYREGQLAIPWGLIAGGIIFLFFGRILQAAQAAELLDLPAALNSGLNLVVGIFFAAGFYTYQKYIS